MSRFQIFLLLVYITTSFSYSYCYDYTNSSTCTGDDDCSWTDYGDNVGVCEAVGCATNDTWAVDYVGKSTQFKLYDPCEDNTFIKIKMEDLTEYTMDGTKTTNKQTSFASTSWAWDQDNGVSGTYQGNSALVNCFRANLSSKAGDGAGFDLCTYLLYNGGTVNGDDVDENSIKFSVNITNWVYLQSTNYLVLCIGLMTNNAQAEGTNSDGENTYYLDGFKIINDDTAMCNGEEIYVNVSQSGNGGGNQMELCFAFQACDADIFYDPTVSADDDDDSAVGWACDHLLTVVVYVVITATLLL